MNEVPSPMTIDVSSTAQTRRWSKRFARHCLDASVILVVTMLLSGILLSVLFHPNGQTLTGIVDPTSLISRLFWLAMVGCAFLVYRFSIEEESSQRVSSGVWRVIDRSQEYGVFALFRSLIKEPEVIILLLRSEVPLGECIAALQEKESQGPGDSQLDAVISSAYSYAAEHGRSGIGIVELFAGLLSQPSMIELLSAWPQAHAHCLDAARWQARLASLRRRARFYHKRASWLPRGPMNVTMTSTATPLLDLVSRDLTESAKRGGFQALLGRDVEFESLWKMIEGQQRHIIAVGNPGVGKSSFFQELAQRIVEGRVPSILSDHRLLSIDPGRLLAGATHPGELALRFQRLIAEVARAKNVVLLFEEIEQWVGLGSGERGMDVVDELLRTIERSGLVVFATTGVVEWTQTLEKKGSFVSVFHRFDIEELSREGAQEVLEAHAASQEGNVQVLVTVPAIREAITASARLIHDRYLPEKALQVLDEAIAAVPSDQKPIPLCTKAVVDEVVSRMTHVPIGQVGSAEKDLLLNLEDRLSTQIVGQTTAIASVANALRRARAQVEERSRPIANLLFLGPTGVGKTLIARTVAHTLLGNAMKMVRLDMSEYQQAGSIERLLGVAGSGQGGVVTEQLRSNPYCLLLLDELEKAHPKILTVLLQLMDEARITDVTGRTIDATNILLIATSNAATPFITSSFQEGRGLETIRKELLERILPTIFPPEFINRFDDVIIFEPLTSDHIERIAGLELEKIHKTLQEKGIEVEFPPPTIRWIASIGFNQQYGARPLRRAIQDNIENALARAMLEGSIQHGSKIRILPSGIIEPIG